MRRGAHHPCLPAACLPPRRADLRRLQQQQQQLTASRFLYPQSDMWCVVWAAAWFASVLGATQQQQPPSPPPPDPAPLGKCKLSQFACLTGTRCVALDRFCDAVIDCDDNSDEPRFCTPCNRTYFGEVGRTYEIEVRRPHDDQLPYACHLNFTAAGGQWGDLVQLTFDSFTVGKFTSFAADGCPHGHMSINELGLPDTGGQWCGSAWGYTVYFSEMNSVDVALHLTRLSEQGIGHTFDFKLNYRFLQRAEAALRFGVSESEKVERGVLVPGTYCDRVFTRCDVRRCRLQSPNFPGIYPRNVTCRYAIVQTRVPDGQHATITVRQPDSRRVHVKDRVVQYERSQRVLRVGDQCNVIRDHLTVYDGFAFRDKRTDAIVDALEQQPTRLRRALQLRRKVDALANGTLEVSSKGAVIARLCGGDAVPDIVSSGPRMLVEFSTSAFDTPFHPTPVSYLPGFELDIEVRTMPVVQPRSFAQQGKCVFTVSSFESRQGQLGPPMHSLPANTTCTYEFAGRPNERVWIAFLKYHVAERAQNKVVASLGLPRVPVVDNSADPGTEDPKKSEMSKEDEDNDCPARLRIWDGTPPTTLPYDKQDNSSKLLGEFCRDESPRLCDHSLLSNSTRFPRPCTADESYLSSGPKFTLEHLLRYGTALHPVSFVLRYEFVDVSQGGVPVSTTAAPFSLPMTAPSPWTCDREFRTSKGSDSGTFRSPRAVFFYGRGGNPNLSCMYWFAVDREQRQSVRLSVNRAKFGDRRCVTRVDMDTGRRKCEFRGGAKGLPVALLRFYEVPWPGVLIARDCLCDRVASGNAVVVEGAPGASLVVNFTVEAMNVTQDAGDFMFEAEYRFRPPPACPQTADAQRLQGVSGDLTLRSPSDAAAPDPLHPGSAQALAYGDECPGQPWLVELQEPFHYLYLRVRGLEITNGQGGEECRTRNRVVLHRTNSLLPPTVVSGRRRRLVRRRLQPGWKTACRASRTRARRPWRCPELDAVHLVRAVVGERRAARPSGFDELDANCQVQAHSPILELFGGGSRFVLYLAAGAAGLLIVVSLLTCVIVTTVRLKRRATVRDRTHAWCQNGGSAPSTATVAPGLGPPMTATLRHKNGTLRSGRAAAVGTIYGKDDLC
ncbi:Hypothetical predicted protein [Cloeon dipterum]|uniref:CUB domain-containing protein n=1 Tax=Cloeon dipterum TaxID=197152 RepID=A0A8S1CQY0_9INSE|nr:Hypothetical predicted protein [Cloeon dipterum]